MRKLAGLLAIAATLAALGAVFLSVARGSDVPVETTDTSQAQGVYDFGGSIESTAAVESSAPQEAAAPAEVESSAAQVESSAPEAESSAPEAAEAHLEVESTDAPQQVTGVPLGERTVLLNYLPPDNFYDNLRLQSPIKFYDAASLYQYIDGQAEGFISYNFQALESATYKDGDNSVVIDVYDMEKPILAFGLYSTFRAPVNDFLHLGGQGFATSDGCMFYQGSMVVRISADYADAQSVAQAAEAAAKAVAVRVPNDSAGLEILEVLPKEGKTANSDKYYLTSALGQSFLTNGVVAEYLVGDVTARLFVCGMNDAHAAAAAYGDYLTFAGANGNIAETEKGKEFAGDVKYYGQTVVFVAGRFVAGGVGLPAAWQPLIDSLKKSVGAHGGASDATPASQAP